MTKQDKDHSDDLINEILAEADPGFVKELGVIDPDVLNGQEIQQVSDESPDAPSQGRLQRIWNGRDKRAKIIMATGGFIVGVAGPMLALAFFGFFTPEYTDEDGFILSTVADETITIAKDGSKQNLFSMFPVLIYAIEIPEKVYIFKPGGNIRYGRFAFYIELYNKKDVYAYENRIDHVEEAIVNVIRKTEGEEWIGNKHKERIREMLLTEINNAMTVRAKTVRFKSIFI